jgi:hypothetical protein
LAVHIQIKNMADIIARLTDKKEHPETAIPFMASVIDEAEKWGSKPFYFHNAQLQVRDAGTRYDFASCNDPQWNRMNEEMQALKARMKEREELLKSLPISGGALFDMETGEIVDCNSPVKTGTATVFVTIN